MDGFPLKRTCRVDGDIRHRILQIITEPHRYIQVPVCMGDIVIDMNRQQVGDRITDCTSIQPGIDMTVLLNQVAAGAAGSDTVSDSVRPGSARSFCPNIGRGT